MRLYLAHVNVTKPKEVLNIGFLSFPKTLLPSFLHHICLQFLVPLTFSLENLFLYLFPLFFLLKNNTYHHKHALEPYLPATCHCQATFLQLKHLPNKSKRHQPTSVELFLIDVHTLIECFLNVYIIYTEYNGNYKCYNII